MGSTDQAFAAYVQAFVSEPARLPSPAGGETDDLSAQRVVFDAGLGDDEFAAIEARFRFTFPADLRALLAVGLPVSDGFPNWRSAPEDDLERLLEWPADGICFDIERSGFWLGSWGPKPLDLDAAVSIARERIAQAPTLIPIYRQHYIADEPPVAGNPVFSVHKRDIIVYADGLHEYLERDFKAREVGTSTRARAIRFWSDLAA